jgi:hypothetical protein
MNRFPERFIVESCRQVSERRLVIKHIPDKNRIVRTPFIRFGTGDGQAHSFKIKSNWFCHGEALRNEFTASELLKRKLLLSCPRKLFLTALCGCEQIPTFISDVTFT